ncbi:MAG: FAD-dependent monooxygenase [Proteobacteria bacterium]|nr:FAD-dependent monooxygenase [Pseudomonadota bacterium]
MTEPRVLIAGAGPTGLTLALWLTRQGIPVRLIDPALRAGTTSRALAVQARTLELYGQLGIADALLANGHRVPAINLWVAGEHKARLPFETIGGSLTRYAFLEIFPQDEHERLLIGRLAELGVTVERGCELTGFTEGADGLTVQLRSAAGESSVRVDYLAGCDGARSKVRALLGTGFPGGTYAQVFYVADIEAQGAPVNGELHIDLDEADFLAVFPMKGTGRARLVGTVRGERAEHAETLQFADVSTRAMQNLRLEVSKVNWFSTYHVHHRVSEHFRLGRAFLLGDAAHIHSPAGGQGMNTGIGDAVNLAWKLATVLRGEAPATLLDSYEPERRQFAQKLVDTTDRVFSFATADGPIADLVRTRLVPLIAPRALAFESVREFMFRTVSQIMVNYRGRPLSEGTAGAVHGGDRLPWVAAGGIDNYDPLSEIRWQVHVYGSPGPALPSWCRERGLALHVFDFTDAHADAGLARDALYLMRPDTYVALAHERCDVSALERYFAVRGIKPAGPPP